MVNKRDYVIQERKKTARVAEQGSTFLRTNGQLFGK